jgi:3,4-dihydroxy 2-butanone 4-phosphate synthase/GTP cyclohydrolase II
MYGGDFAMHIYINKIAHAEHVALVKGDLKHGDEPPLVRMHALNVLEDVLGDRSHGHGGELQTSMRLIAEAGRGVIVLLRDPSTLLRGFEGLDARPSEALAKEGAQADSLSQRLEARQAGREPAKELRDYGVGAQILLDLGVRDMILLSNSHRTIVGLEGYGLRVVEQRPIHT